MLFAGTEQFIFTYTLHSWFSHGLERETCSSLQLSTVLKMNFRRQNNLILQHRSICYGRGTHTRLHQWIMTQLTSAVWTTRELPLTNISLRSLQRQTVTTDSRHGQVGPRRSDCKFGNSVRKWCDIFLGAIPISLPSYKNLFKTVNLIHICCFPPLLII
jgi:hypothetical protein